MTIGELLMFRNTSRQHLIIIGIVHLASPSRPLLRLPRLLPPPPRTLPPRLAVLVSRMVIIGKSTAVRSSPTILTILGTVPMVSRSRQLPRQLRPPQPPLQVLLLPIRTMRRSMTTTTRPPVRVLLASLMATTGIAHQVCRNPPRPLLPLRRLEVPMSLPPAVLPQHQLWPSQPMLPLF